MQKSTNYGFNLPSRDSDDLADVNSLSNNFREIDRILFSNEQDLKKKPNGTIVTEINEDSTDQQIPSAKAVQKAISKHKIYVDSELSATSENPVKNKVLSNSFANALKGAVSGNVVSLPDVSPIPHEIKVKLSGFSVEEVFKYDENSGAEEGFLYTDITESGIYVVESVTYDEYGDSTYITFEGGVTAETNWRDGEPFAVGDVVFVKVEGETYSFSILHGAVVQRYGLNLFDQETFFRSNGFELQADGSWLGKRVFKSAFTPQVQIKVPMYIRLKGKNISASKPFYLTINYVEGGASTACVLPSQMTKMEDFSFATLADKTVKNIYWNYSGTGGSDGVSDEYYIKDVIFSYADAPYEPYTGEQETLNADEEGNISIVGNGESMTLISDDGVTMEAEYNRDINKAFAELLEKIGGNV